MKNGIFLLLGLMVIIRSNGIMDHNPYCKYEDESNQLAAKCYHHPDIELFNKEHYVPIANLSTNIESLTFQTKKSPDWTWHINDLDYFKRFFNLTKIQIYGRMSFSKDLDSQTLKTELFNAPNLNTLILFNNGFNSNDHHWTLPSQLKNLTIIGNDYTEFNLDKNPNLEEIHFHRTNLATMPKLSDPLPPLKVVNFRNNVLLEINVDKIASFCHATTLALDANNLLSAKMHCECMRMKRWIADVLKTTEEKFFEKPLNCSNVASTNCDNYTLDTAEKNRNSCLSQIETLQAATNSNSTTTQRSEGIPLLYLIIGSVAIVLVVLGAVAIAAVHRYRNPTSDHFDSGKQDDDTYDDDRFDLDEHEHELSDMESID